MTNKLIPALALIAAVAIIATMSILGTRENTKRIEAFKANKAQCLEESGKWRFGEYGHCATIQEYCRDECASAFGTLNQLNKKTSVSNHDTIADEVWQCINQCIETE